MDRWIGKVAVVTGASAGIGLAIARSLLKNGMVVVGLARRLELMEERMSDLKGPGKFYAKKCDVADEEQVKMIFSWIKNTLKSLDILINNAGTFRRKTLIDISTEDLVQVINLNLTGNVYCIREAGKLMRQSDQEAVIVNINSIMSINIPSRGEYNVYPATKAALKSVSEICRREFIKNKNIRVANVSPGLVTTELFEVAKIPAQALESEPALLPEDVASSVVHIISAPSHVNITELTIIPTGSRLS